MTIEVEPGVTLTGQVTGAKIRVTDQGVQPTEITIGDPDVDPTVPEVYRQAARALTQLAALQRRL